MDNTVKLEVRQPGSGVGQTPVSVIVPLAEHETLPNALLTMLPSSFEVILARQGTRASSMNQAASIATGRHLWFVHADTTFRADSVARLLDCLRAEGVALHYFDLQFDGGILMRLTELGVKFRSRVLDLPFGDQALCLPAATFRELGGYDESVAFGEDHLLVRKAWGAGIPVLPVGTSVMTSARKYRDNGWFRTTIKHWRLTLHHGLRAS
jgi:hypothetical protein